MAIVVKVVDITAEFATAVVDAEDGSCDDVGKDMCGSWWWS